MNNNDLSFSHSRHPYLSITVFFLCLYSFAPLLFAILFASDPWPEILNLSTILLYIFYCSIPLVSLVVSYLIVPNFRSFFTVNITPTAAIFLSFFLACILFLLGKSYAVNIFFLVIIPSLVCYLFSIKTHLLPAFSLLAFSIVILSTSRGALFQFILVMLFSFIPIFYIQFIRVPFDSIVRLVLKKSNLKFIFLLLAFFVIIFYSIGLYTEYLRPTLANRATIDIVEKNLNRFLAPDGNLESLKLFNRTTRIVLGTFGAYLSKSCYQSLFLIDYYVKNDFELSPIIFNNFTNFGVRLFDGLYGSDAYRYYLDSLGAFRSLLSYHGTHLYKEWPGILRDHLMFGGLYFSFLSLILSGFVSSVFVRFAQQTLTYPSSFNTYLSRSLLIAFISEAMFYPVGRRPFAFIILLCFGCLASVRINSNNQKRFSFISSN